ncbi:MAG: carboxypeptidase-like regulatory domain-containing protein, partial [Bacteroidota bacterium]
SIGDTLWFKAYLLDKVNLTGSKMSGLLYVELDTDSAEMVRRISIPIKDGVGWGQIPLTGKIFRGGSHVLRAYTKWMQNFGDDYVFTQNVYIGIPSEDTWMVRSATALKRVADKNQLSVDIKLNRADGLSSPVALKKVEVKIFDEWHYIFKEEMLTGLDGSIKLSQAIKDKADATRVRVQITSLEKADNGKVVQIPLNINRDQKMDMQFLPEGGKLVSGIKSTIGFKAISEDGKGVAALGAIFDGVGNEVVLFTTLHNGMGSFEFTPKAGETYIAKILQPVTKVVALPKINPTGTVMRVTNPEQGDNISITLAGLDKMPTDSAAYLIGASRGVIYFSQKLETSKPDIVVAKSLFPTGIARFTLFKGKTPLNERAVFIDNKDQLTINITSNKTNYNKRDSVGLEIEVKDKSGFPVRGNFSLAVTDDMQIRPDSVGNNNMATSLLLNADLKGYVETPGYYINRKDKKAWQALDNLLLTQGWTGYDWKDVFAPKKQPRFEAEKEFRLTGIVSNLSNKPVPNAEVLISSQKPSFLTKTITDMDGRYIFTNLPPIDSGSFFIQANNEKGKARSFGNISVEKFKAPVIPMYNTLVMPWYINTDSTQLNFIKQRIARNKEDLKLTGNVLKEVKIKSKKIIPESFNRNGPGNSDMAFDEADIKASATMNLYDLLKQKLPGVKVTNDRLLPTLKWNNSYLIVNVDGGGLPIRLDPNSSPEDLIEEMNKFGIVGYKGMEVNYSPKNSLVYYEPSWRRTLANLKPAAVVKSEDSLRSGYVTSDLPSGAGWYYRAGFRAGYLEARANVYSMDPPPIAVVEITTKNGSGWFFNESPASVTYRPLPVMHPQQFYSPRYNVVLPVIEPDMRSTLYWAPDVTTDQNGKAKVSFYTSDNKGKYTIKVAGVDAGGGIGDATTKINTNNTMP